MTTDLLITQLEDVTRTTGGATTEQLDQLRFGDAVDPEPIDWLWYGRLAFRKFCGLIGMPDVGKDTLTATIAACLSLAAGWPDRRPTPEGARPTLYLSSEDAFQDTILPRFMAAGGDRRYLAHYPVVFTHEGKYQLLSLDQHLPLIGHLMDAVQRQNASGPGLLVLSPFDAFLSSKVDAWKAADIRRVLAPLGPLIEAKGWCVQAIAHLNKGDGSQAALHRIANSQAFSAALRVAYLAGKDADNEARRVYIPMKRNLLPPDVQGLGYKLDPVPTPGLPNPTKFDTVPKVTWLPDPVTLTPEDVLAKKKELTAEERAEAWLHENVPVGEAAAVDREVLANRAKAEGRNWELIRKRAVPIGVQYKRLRVNNKLGPTVWWWDM
jgi:putative DNA primase/helicase